MSNNTKYCPKCGVVMYVDTNKHRTDPSCYEVFCPQCGETEIVKAEIITMADLGNHIECPFCNKKDQRIAELESDLENLTAYDLKKSHEYSIKVLIQANENLSKQIAELESKKQNAVKEFADKIKDINYIDYCEIRNYDQIKYVWFNYISFNRKINKLLKEKGIE